MADVMYVQDEDAENSDEGSGDMHESEVRNGSNQDVYPPLVRLEKYATSDNIYNRQVVGRVALETLRAVADTPEDVRAAMEIISAAAKDPEVSVRAELMEQLPHIAMLCHEERDKLHHVVQEYLLPLVIKFLGDTDNQVRKTTQAALLVLMEQGLIEMSAVEEQVCPMILMLTELDSLVEFHTGAVALMSKMAPLIGCNATERLFMHRFAALCSDPVFYVRKVCASNFGEFCAVVGTRPTEEYLLSRFVELCGDAVWGVRKACAEVFMSVSCTCTLQTRKNTLAPVFANLLVDQSRWVRMSAFQALGPFISTFADLTSSGLAYNQHGELVLLNPAENEARLKISEKGAGDASSGSSETSCNEEVRSSESCAQSYSITNTTQPLVCNTSDSSAVICYMCDTQSAIVPSCSETLNGVTRVDMRPNSDLSSDSELNLVNTGDEIDSLHVNMCDNDKSVEEVSVSATKHCSVSDANDSLQAQVGSVSNEVESFNTFLYWRVPIPELDPEAALAVDPKPKAELHENVHTNVSLTSGLLPRAKIQMGIKPDVENLPPKLEKDIRKDEMSTVTLLSRINTANVTLLKEEKQAPELNPVGNKNLIKAVSKYFPLKPSADGCLYDEQFFSHSTYEGHPENEMEAVRVKFDELFFGEDGGGSNQTPVVPSTPPTQDIVPQLLIDHFVSMTHPSQAQNTDNEITHYCAFSIPAVALTLGRSNWNLIKKAYEALASDMQWKVRRTVAASIHELAVILGEDLATKDLVPVFNGFIKDLDEVRIGALKHLADFLKLLRPTERNSYLHRLSDFHFTDNECNWRFREELAEQLLQSVTLFSPEDTREHITPIAISLLMDKVAAVRQMALYLVTQLVHHVSTDVTLVRGLLAELAETFAHNRHWNRRQTFALLCSRVASERILDDEHFASDVFPHLLDLSWDPVPNVRLAVARTLATDVIVQSYFSSEELPHNEVLLQCLKRLEKDSDRDVRYFASRRPNQSSSSEFCNVEE